MGLNVETLENYDGRQIYMTIEQAEDLARMLTESIRDFKARKSGAAKENKAD
jgi:hypothetical protein